MKRILEKSPLVHTVIHLEISRCPALKLSDPALEDALQSRMIDIGFQDYIRSEHKALEFSATVGDDTKAPSHKEVITPRRLFRSASRQQLVEISETGIIFKNTSYSSFEDMRATFSECLEAISGTVTQTQKGLLKRIGLRYTDVIAPSPDSQLSDYFVTGITPVRLDMIENPVKLQGVMMSRVQTATNSEMRVVFEELPTRDNMIGKILPNDLAEHDDKCTLNIPEHQWWGDAQSGTYGILDIDHIHFFRETPVWDHDVVIDELEALHKATSDVFWGSISKKAQKEWEIKTISEGSEQ